MVLVGDIPPRPERLQTSQPSKPKRPEPKPPQISLVIMEDNGNGEEPHTFKFDTFNDLVAFVIDRLRTNPRGD